MNKSHELLAEKSKKREFQAADSFQHFKKCLYFLRDAWAHYLSGSLNSRQWMTTIEGLLNLNFSLF